MNAKEGAHTKTLVTFQSDFSFFLSLSLSFSLFFFPPFLSSSILSLSLSLSRSLSLTHTHRHIHIDIFKASYFSVVSGCLSEFLLPDLPCWANQNTAQCVTSSPSILINPHPPQPPLPPTFHHLSLPSSSPYHTHFSCFLSIHLCLFCPLSSFFPLIFNPLLLHYSAVQHTSLSFFLSHPKWSMTNSTSLNPSFPPSFSSSLLTSLNLPIPPFSSEIHHPPFSLLPHLFCFTSLVLPIQYYCIFLLEQRPMLVMSLILSLKLYFFLQ